MTKATIVSDNGFTKIFKWDDIDVFLSKAYDEDTKLHYSVISIKEIKEVNAHGVQFPFEFTTEMERDEHFSDFNEQSCMDFVDYSIEYIKQMDKFKEEEAEKIRLKESENQNQLSNNTDNL